MIKAITVVNFRGESMRMELSKPELTGMMVYEVTGIGAGQADINMSEMATTDGGAFNSARLTTRNIVMKIKLMALPTVEEMRHKCYRYFPVKKFLTLKFETDSGVRQIDGYVETNDPVVFSSEEYTQISIICPDPYFYDERYTDMVLSGYTPLFEFPFSNESLTENLILFDDLKFDKRTSFYYNGESDTGVLIRIRANGTAKNINLYNNDTNEKMSINTDKFPSVIGDHLVTSDLIEISTYLGRRTAYLTREGIRYNIINSLGRHSPWFTIVAGLNTFTYTAEVGESLIDVSFYYKNVYEGV